MAFTDSANLLVSISPNAEKQLIETFQRLLQSGQMKRISITDVARKAGVSNATASYALSGNGRVAEKTRAKVLRAADELGFIRDEAAARLRTGRSKMIGVVINDINNPFFNELVGAFESAAWAAGYLTILCTSQDDVERQKRLISSLVSQGVAGVAISPVKGSGTEDLLPLRTRGIAHLVCVRDINDESSGFVGADDFEAGKLAGAYMIRHGYRRLCFVGGFKHTATWRRRRKGILAAIEDSTDETITFEEYTNGEGHEFGREAVDAILKKTNPNDPRPAILGFNDSTAIGAYLAAGSAGISVGKDLPVIGMDNIPTADQVLPGLTTVELFPRRMGSEAARALIGQIKDSQQAASKIILRPVMVERGSAPAL